MPSPFPGMDPWLEDPNLFPDFHATLMVVIKFAVQRQLKPPYYSAINSRIWVERGTRFFEPDAEVLHRRPTPHVNGHGHGGGTGEGGIATAVTAETMTEPTVIRTLPPAEVRQTFLNIHTRYSDGRERLVTSVEILSPSNKRLGHPSRDLYTQKFEEVLSGEANLIEIDLLRGGTHTTAVPRLALEDRAGPFDYHVCTTHAGDRYTHYTYPVRLADRLPTIRVPLLPDDGFVPLDLQKVFDECYDASGYRGRVAYTTLAPVPPLTPEQAAWAAERLRAAGVLPPG